MSSIVKQSKTVFSRAILALIDGYSEDIKKHVEYDCKGQAKINGIELLMFPWYGYFYLSLRPREPKRVKRGRDSRADWNEYGEKNAPWAKNIVEQDQAIAFMTAVYNDPPINARKKNHIAHLLFLGGAEALLEKEISDALLALNIPAKYYQDSFPSSLFEYMVFDEDACTIANYCEHILLDRITRSYEND